VLRSSHTNSEDHRPPVDPPKIELSLPQSQSGATSRESAIEIVREVRAMTWAWTEDKGPVSEWPSTLVVNFRDASRNGTIDRFVSDWRSHCGVGRALVRSLRQFTGSRFPPDDKEMRDVVRQSFELLTTLSEGIAIIEAHLNILPLQFST
jgi:hypothetical protein